MNLPAMALTVRSLRADNRAALTYVLRAGLGLFLLGSLATSQLGFSSAPGLSFFSSIIVMDFFAISAIALVVFASAITEEREEGMLGLLKMTGLNPVSILLGKSLSRLTNGAFLLLAQLPFTLLAVTLGGVSPRQIFAAYAALFAYMVFVCGLGLLMSTLSASTRQAGTRTAWALAFYYFGATIVHYGLLLLIELDVVTETGNVMTAWESCLPWIYETMAYYRITQGHGRRVRRPRPDELANPLQHLVRAKPLRSGVARLQPVYGRGLRPRARRRTQSPRPATQDAGRQQGRPRLETRHRVARILLRHSGHARHRQTHERLHLAGRRPRRGAGFLLRAAVLDHPRPLRAGGDGDVLLALHSRL